MPRFRRARLLLVALIASSGAIGGCSTPSATLDAALFMPALKGKVGLADQAMTDVDTIDLSSANEASRRAPTAPASGSRRGRTDFRAEGAPARGDRCSPRTTARRARFRDWPGPGFDAAANSCVFAKNRTARTVAASK